MSNMGPKGQQPLRRSQRGNKGKVPVKYQDYVLSPELEEDEGAMSLAAMEFNQTPFAPPGSSTRVHNTLQNDPTLISQFSMTDQEDTIVPQITSSVTNAQTKNTVIKKLKSELQSKYELLQAEINATEQQLAQIQLQESGIPDAMPQVSSTEPIVQSYTVPMVRSSTVPTTNQVLNLSPIGNCYVPPVVYQPKKKLYDLPAFSGNPEEWPKFISSYNQSNTAYGYTNLENLMRLEKSLRGRALDCVHAMMIHPDSVNDIISELEFRFGRSDLLVKSQMNKLRLIQPIKENDISQFINFSTQIRNLVAFLKSARAEKHLQNPMLLEELVAKLPLARRCEWAQHLSLLGHEADVGEFDAWMSKVARYLSLVEHVDSTSNLKSTTTKKYTYQVTAETISDPKCNYCSHFHKIIDCPEFKQLSIEQRWQWVKKVNACFSCLFKGHQVLHCRYSKICNIDNCKKKHHKLLHETLFENRPPPSTARETKPITTTVSDKSIYFMMVPVVLSNGSKQVETFAMCDNGSSCTIMEEELANELNLKGKPEKMKISWIDNRVVSQSTHVVNCSIQGLSTNCKILKLNDVRTFPKLRLPQQSVDMNELSERYPQLSGLPIMSYKNARPRLLIGLDNGKTFMIKTSVDCSPHGPMVSKTPLGWLLYGTNLSSDLDVKLRIFQLNHCIAEDVERRQAEIDEMIQKYYETEEFGIKSDVTALQSTEVDRALQILQDTTVFNGNSYETGLLWKSNDTIFPDSYDMAVKRFDNLEKKFKKDPTYAMKYERAMNDFVTKGYARQLSSAEANAVTQRTWYLPHFGVTTDAKPDKLRLVFDAAASARGVSLNSHLLKGPDLNQPLLVVLSQFRELPIAVCADIREMFCQVKIRQADRDSQRFIWKDHVGKRSIFEMQSMIFGAACSPTAAQFVKNRHADEYACEYPEAVNAIKSNFYVDDFVKSFPDEASAIEISHQVKAILREAGFDLRGFLSNSGRVTNTINDLGQEPKMLLNMNVENGLTVDKVLGLYWQSQTDQFVFRLKFNNVSEEVLSQQRPPTKREILSLMMSIFDPFGYLCDYHVGAKLIVQMAWNRNLGWDEPLPEDLTKLWYDWQSQLHHLTNIRIPRCYTLEKPTQVQLHTFVDASEQAFAAVCYFRIESSRGVDVVFVYGKTRVAPKKQLSIPRLELQAAVLGIRLSDVAVSSHNIKPAARYYWSDSKTVVHWVKSESRSYKPFVSHRIAEILDSSSPGEWKWLPTIENVADDATRLKSSHADENSRWLKGPKFLYESMSEWPSQPNDFGHYEVKEELKNTPTMFVIKPAKVVVDFSRFSKYQRLVRCIAWLKRFVFNVKAKIKNVPMKSGEITTEEFNNAEICVCRLVQAEAFPNELDDLKRQSTVGKNSEIVMLNPYIHEDGVIRLMGRIDAAMVFPLATKRPVIMPRQHQVTELLIHYHHQQCFHQNDETVIGLIRQKFWIPCLRQRLKSVKSKCLPCRIYKAKPRQPMMGSLPIDRLAVCDPFTYTGVDYFGPLTVVIGRRHEKRWVALFTCLSTRAVHLEVATDLTTDSFILCLRNFVNVRGVPKRMRSDNGTNFVGLDKELKNIPEFFDKGMIQQEMTKFGIDWKFNSPTDASAGESWERLVQTVKRSMRVVFENRSIREDTLRSTLLEIANIVNNHPLTHVPISHEEEEPLTPNHFLLGKLNSTQSPGIPVERLMCLRKQWSR